MQSGPPGKIVLVGFDMRLDLGVHWHGKHERGLNNPHQGHVDRWRSVLDSVSQVFERLGVKVINTSMVSALTAYPKMSLPEALEC